MRDASARDVLRIAIPAILLLAVAAVVAWHFTEPLPPRAIRLAAGAPDGAYAETAARYREILARDGVRLDIVTTAGSMDNIRLLRAPRGGVDVGFVQAGTGAEAMAGGADLRSLASVFMEPLWVFVRAGVGADRLSELRGRRIAVGAEGSGTRVLAMALLAASAVTDVGGLLPIGGQAAVEALLAGTVDAAFFVTARPSPALDALLQSPAVKLVSLRQAEAYTRRYPFLSRVTLPEGALDLSAPIPAERVEMLAPAATLVVRDGLHPAIVDLLMGAAIEVHRPGRLFEHPGQFPSLNYVDFPLSDEARRFFRSGPSFLRRHLPFWPAIAVERAVILGLPLLTLLIPLVRLAPDVYDWQVRRRIYCWYQDLRELEARAAAATSPAEQAQIRDAVRTLDARVRAVKVPLGYARELFDLREHVEFTARLLGPDRLAALREREQRRLAEPPERVSREA
jgi:TRAP transporter TAXI family solute receptor